MENLTLKELKEIVNLFGNKKEKEFEIGKNYFIKTVTYHYVGTVVKETSRFVYLENCSLIADSGTFSEAMQHGIISATGSEIEPYLPETRVDVGIGSISEKLIYIHELPTKQK
jgi:hypothetical protein